MDMITEGAVVARHEAARAAQPNPGEYLAFRLGNEEYAVDIQRVQEIRSYEQPTRIANAPSFVKGVVNLRGVIVPIVDLRLKLACESAEYTSFTVVIVLNVQGRIVGAVVDSVSDVLDLQREAIKPPPELAGAGDNCVTAIASVGERMLILVDIESLLGGAAIGLTEKEA